MQLTSRVFPIFCRALVGAWLVLGTLLGARNNASAVEVGAGVRAGTLGLGGDIDVGLNNILTARLGFSGLTINQTVNVTDVTYGGKLKLSIPYAMIDVFPFSGGLRVTAGAVGSGPKFDVVARSNGSGSYVLNRTQYSGAELTSLSGQFKFSNSVAPYVGVGYGNVASSSHRLTFLADLGVMYGGTPEITLNATCSPSASATTCRKLVTDVGAEGRKLQADVTFLRWYPVVSLGLGYRF
jgi:hypothetical protein